MLLTPQMVPDQRQNSMVSMIIVDYKSMDKTYEYIAACAQNIRGIDHYVIVDNASDIPIAPCVSDFDGNEVCIVSDGTNSGYAKGNNLGAKTAADLWKDDYYIFSNNDLRIDQPFDVKELLAPFDEDSNIAAVGPRILGLDGGDQNPLPEYSDNYILFGHFLSLLPPKGMAKAKKKKPATKGRCRAVCGAFICVKANDFDAVGGFDDNTFLFMEEEILNKRLKIIGKYMYYNDDVTVIHEHSVTVRSVMSVVNSLKIDFDSRYYYSKAYAGAGNTKLALAKANFGVTMALFKLKKAIKK